MTLEVRPLAERRGLLQTFRSIQAIAETGVTVILPESEIPRWDYAAQWFAYSYRADHHQGPSLTVEIDHREPSVSIGSLRRPLLFPHKAFDLYRQCWTSRTVFATFAGNPNRARKKTLKKWRRLARRSRDGSVSLSWTQKGRHWPEKAWDPGYVADLCRSQFVLCPSGDFQWTYRFFEAAAGGAIPLVEASHPLYEGFHHYRIDEKAADLDWTPSKAEENHELARALMTVHLDELTGEISRLLDEP